MNPCRSGRLENLLLLSLRQYRLSAFPPPYGPLWGRIELGGRAILRDEPAMAHSTISSVRATPTPARPHKRGRVR